MREIHLWTEGYAATGEESGAIFHGVFKANSLKNAVVQFKKTLTDQQSKDCVDIESLTFWGCRFFDNATDAKKSFG